MEHIWAPWRIGYIRAPKEEGCFFCRKSGEADDAANHVVARRSSCFALMNTYPYTPGHLMVAPYKHTPEMDELSQQELMEFVDLTLHCRRVLTRAINPQGFNIGFNLGAAAGAGVPEHLHLHIVPRWVGDTNFMTVVGDTRVIPEAINEMYAQLKAESANFD